MRPSRRGAQRQLWQSGETMLYSPAHGDVAQLGEHWLCKPGVEGSSPFVSTMRIRRPEACIASGLFACTLRCDPCLIA